MSSSDVVVKKKKTMEYYCHGRKNIFHNSRSGILYIRFLYTISFTGNNKKKNNRMIYRYYSVCVFVNDILRSSPRTYIYMHHAMRIKTTAMDGRKNGSAFQNNGYCSTRRFRKI